MISRNRSLISLTLFISSLQSELAFAVESSASNSSFIMWPLVALVAFIIFFGKKLIAEATPKIEHHQSHTDSGQETEKISEPVQNTNESEENNETIESEGSIDLTENASQCQSTTAKGTRCKRTANLETTHVKIDGTTYKVMVCRQHNNDSMKPFNDLIK